ncbi:BON domain-containing protein [Lamprocystis purpurea]|jgi:hyperosmotically inducible protein|uniref:BON domain-containing protein n=1 Tax=Lamprocystis purpurea TaxID=61598 RepID=UPI00039EAF0E|nr:BON domain-containing protein [Lamprocystis purpurea]
MRNQTRTLSLVLTLALAGLGLSAALPAAAEEGMAERTGQKIDQAAEVAGDKLGAAKDSVGRKAEQASDYMGDAAITAKIKSEILVDSSLKVLQIHVTTTDGVVNLSGAIDSQLNIDRAVSIAANTQHVKLVQNALVVKAAN